MNEATITCVYNFISKFKKISYYKIKKELLQHPGFPSLASISDLLHRHDITHIVAKTNIQKLKGINTPFIAHLKIEQLIYISKITNKYIYFYPSPLQLKKVSLKKFESLWSGIVFISLEKPIYKKLHNIIHNLLLFSYKNIFYIFLFFLFILVTSIYNNHILLLFSFVNILGLFITYIILTQERENNETFKNQFCKIGKYFDCEKVTSSKYANIAGIITWAQLGFAYFLSLIIICTLLSSYTNYHSLFIYIILSIPFTFLSIIAQAFLIRKFCLLCCTTISIIWIQTLILSFASKSPLSWTFMLYFAFIYILCLIGVIIYENHMHYIQQKYYNIEKFNKIKYDITLHLLLQHHLPIIMDENTGIILHKATNDNRVTFFLSISCPHCAESLKYLKQAIKRFPEYNYHIIFTNKDPQSKKIISYLIDINTYIKEEEYFDILTKWYKSSEKSINYLQKLYPLNNKYDQTIFINKMQQIWDKTQLQHVPVIMIQNTPLPLEYTTKDILNILYTLSS